MGFDKGFRGPPGKSSRGSCRLHTVGGEVWPVPKSAKWTTCEKQAAPSLKERGGCQCLGDGANKKNG